MISFPAEFDTGTEITQVVVMYGKVVHVIQHIALCMEKLVHDAYTYAFLSLQYSFSLILIETFIGGVC